MENILEDASKVENQVKQPSYNQAEQLSLEQIFLPNKYENLFLAYYIILIPFILGHIFLFTYISNFQLSVYIDVCSIKNSFFTWCIGYEGFSILFFIVLAVLSIKNVLSNYTKK